jgi:hypothetical protein
MVRKLSVGLKFGTLCSFLAVLCLIPAPVVVAQRKAPSPYKVSAVKAMLFYEQTGAFSSNVLADPKIAIQNRQIALGRSTATLVVVEIAGDPGAFDPRRKVVFAATDGRMLKFSRTSDTGVLSEEGKFYVAFWLYDTGCYPVTITARLTGQSPISSVKEIIKFRCGD